MKHEYTTVATIAAALASGDQGSQSIDSLVDQAVKILDAAAHRCGEKNAAVEALQDAAVGNREDADYWKGMYEEMKKKEARL